MRTLPGASPAWSTWRCRHSWKTRVRPSMGGAGLLATPLLFRRGCPCQAHLNEGASRSATRDRWRTGCEHDAHLDVPRHIGPCYGSQGHRVCSAHVLGRRCGHPALPGVGQGEVDDGVAWMALERGTAALRALRAPARGSSPAVDCREGAHDVHLPVPLGAGSGQLSTRAATATLLWYRGGMKRVPTLRQSSPRGSRRGTVVHTKLGSTALGPVRNRSAAGGDFPGPVPLECLFHGFVAAPPGGKERGGAAG